MLAIGAFLFLLVCVFGSYLVSGGSVAPLAEALPFELWTIGGAALGSFVMSNSMHDVKHSIAGFGKIVKGAAFGKTDYIELLSLLYFLVRLASTKGNMAVEPHIEKPLESAAFQKFPRILANKFATATICDYLRMVGMNADDPNQIEDVMARELKKTLNEELHGAHALQTMADGLPALGIVAAVLGVIKTMSHIDRPPAVLGGMIASALTGTFLGVLLAYGMVGPFAGRLKGVVEEEAKYYEVIRAVLVTHLHGNAPQVSVEFGSQDGAEPAHAILRGAGGRGQHGADLTGPALPRSGRGVLASRPIALPHWRPTRGVASPFTRFAAVRTPCRRGANPPSGSTAWRCGGTVCWCRMMPPSVTRCSAGIFCVAGASGCASRRGGCSSVPGDTPQIAMTGGVPAGLPPARTGRKLPQYLLQGSVRE